MNCVSQSRFSYDKNGWSEIVPQKMEKKITEGFKLL